MYGKIFDSIYDGTLYGHWQAIVTMQQLIVLSSADGVVDMTPQAIAARTSIPLEIILAGLKVLADPDPYTRTPGEEGRRIVLLDEHRPWGWRLVNHGKYARLRNMEQKREADRQRISEKRNKSNDVATVSHGVANVAHADADTDANTSKAGRAVALPDWLPLENWRAWLEVRQRVKAPNTVRALKLALGDLERLRAAGADPAAVLDQSTKRGWRALFPLKENAGSLKISEPLASKRSCAYCDEEAVARVGTTAHCRAHTNDAMDGKPLPPKVAMP